MNLALALLLNPRLALLLNLALASLDQPLCHQLSGAISFQILEPLTASGKLRQGPELPQLAAVSSQPAPSPELALQLSALVDRPRKNSTRKTDVELKCRRDLFLF